MTTNFTALQNQTDILEVFRVINDNTQEWLVLGVLITVFVIMFIAMKNYETITAFRTAGFVTSIIAVLFYTIEALSVGYMMIPIIFTGLTILFSIPKLFE